MKAVIIAGGLGTRLRPLTNNTPKPIVPVANRPFVVHQIELLRQHGIHEIILSLHYLPEEIQKKLGRGKELGVKLYYSIEKSPLGTAGAVKNAEEFFDKDPLVVFNGDTLTDINVSKVIELHKKKKARATLTLTPVDDPTAYGLVLTDKEGRVTEFLEKPSWERLEGITRPEINAGIYVLDPKIFRDIPANTPWMFEKDVFPKMLKAGEPIYSYTSERFWIDIGNAQKYRLAHEAILRGEVAVRVFGTRESGGYWVGKKTELAKTVRIVGPVLIGEKVEVNDEAVIKDYAVLGNGVKIGKSSVIDNSILWEGVVVGSHARISHSIIGFNCRIEDSCIIDGAVLADNTVVTRGSVINA